MEKVSKERALEVIADIIWFKDNSDYPYSYKDDMIKMYLDKAFSDEPFDSVGDTYIAVNDIHNKAHRELSKG